MSRNLELANALAKAHAEIRKISVKLEKAKRGLAWAWNNNTDVDAIDWDAFFEEGEEK